MTNSDEVKYVKQIASSLTEVLGQLSQKEQFVLTKRFNLDNTRRYTLEEIGQHFNVTRERIRQIEKNALHKLQQLLPKEPFNDIIARAKQILEEDGGVLPEGEFISLLMNTLPAESQVNYSDLRLLLSVHSDFRCVGNTIQYYPYISFSHIAKDLIQNVTETAHRQLEQQKDIVPHEIMANTVLQQVPHVSHEKFISSSLSLDKRIKKLSSGYGLAKWRHVNPRTLRDKIFYILRQEKKPLHFVDIANNIATLKLDQKVVNLQAVHNELIRYPDFVLIGRGIYALKEWGFKPGKVEDVIERILKGKGPMEQEEIVKAVLDERHVQRVTVLITLKNSQKFVRSGRSLYGLKD